MKWLEKCLSCLYSSTIVPEVIIVDNCSTDNTLEFIADNYPDIYVIKNLKNKGFGQANNQGIEFAYPKGARHFFLLNQDAYVEPDTIEKLVCIQERYSLGILAPMHMNGHGNLCDYNFYRNIMLINPYSNEFFSDYVNNNLNDYYIVEHVPAAIWMVSRECIEKVGGFDPLFFHYGEDGQYRHRVLFHGLQIAVTPSAKVYHDREFKGNIKAFNKNISYARLMGAYCKLNISIWIINRQRLSVHFHLFKSLVMSLLTLRFDIFMNQIKSIMKFYYRIPLIIKSNKINRIQGPNWLNINIIKN